MFGSRDEKIEALTEEIARLKGEIKGLRSERDSAREVSALEEQRQNLLRQVTDLEIEKAKVTEAHAREKREVEHAVGLERKRVEFETTKAKDEAVLEVREENLKADKDRFEEQLKFHETRFNEEVGYLRDLMEKVLKRLPEITIDAGGSARSTSTGDDD